MSYEIPKGKTIFRFGFSDPSQLEEFFQNNKDFSAIAVVGRSNVGKSSLINAIFGKSTARVSNTPGRTREINTFTFPLFSEGKEEDVIEKVVLFDLPGYGFASVPPHVKRNWEILMELFFTSINRKTLVLILQDARHPDQKSDQQFMDYLSSFGHKTFLVLNKLDKLKKQSDKAKLEKKKIDILKKYKTVDQIHYVSAQTGKGLSTLKEAMVNHVIISEQIKSI